MSWNYRVMAFECIPCAEEGIWLEVREVYYDDRGRPNGCSQNPTKLMGESGEEISFLMEKVYRALDKPILWGGDRFPEEYKK